MPTFNHGTQEVCAQQLVCHPPAKQLDWHRELKKKGSLHQWKPSMDAQIIHNIGFVEVDLFLPCTMVDHHGFLPVQLHGQVVGKPINM